jgi:PAS domain S-box-containing protein
MNKSGRLVRPEGEARPGSIFPIVGVAASAGGVESFRRLLPHLPADTGMAFVIAPFSTARPAGVLASLFAGATPMPVREAAPWTFVKPNHVYVIPPDKPTRIVHSVLARAPGSEARRARQPVDCFFRSLAADRRAPGIGLMLSPADANDITWLQAIRENGGLAIVQNESFFGSSSVPPGATPGIADLILSPEEIGDALKRIGRTGDPSHAPGPPDARDLLDRILEVVKESRGMDFFFDKGKAIRSRVLHRMRLCQCESLDGYLAYLESSSAETALLAHDLLMSVNKEIQPANGESPGIGRELPASNPELQSGNRELNSLNYRLQNRNRELSRVNDDLVRLIGGTSIPVFMVDSELRIKFMTPAAERMFNVWAGYVGNPIRDIQPGFSEEDLESRIRRVIDSRAAEEIEVRARDGRCHLLRIDPCLSRDDRIEGAVITVLDVDELHQARSAAVLAVRFADAILESVPIPLLVLDADFKVRAANDAFLADYGLQAADVQNCAIEDVGTAQWGTPEFKGAVRRLQSGETAFEEFECLQDHPGLGKRAVLISARRVLWQGSARILIAIHDITAQRRAETLMAREKARMKRTARKSAAALHESEDALRQSRAELRALTGNLLHAQDEERRRVSRELHDDVSQNVVKLQFDIEALEQSLPADRTREKQGLMAVRDDAARLSNDLRRIAYVLHPSTLDNLGLTGALSAYATEFSKRTGIPVEFITTGVPEFIPQGIASAFYRVTQEALRNVVRHSGAASTLHLTGENSRLVLAIHDNGPGFERQSVRGQGGLGLVSMEERARLIGASFRLDTAPGEGVSITLSAPLGLLD